MWSNRILRGLTLTAAVAAACVAPIFAQRGNSTAPAVTAADYAHAEKFMTWNTTPLVFRSGVSPTWLADDRSAKCIW